MGITGGSLNVLPEIDIGRKLTSEFVSELSILGSAVDSVRRFSTFGSKAERLKSGCRPNIDLLYMNPNKIVALVAVKQIGTRGLFSSVLYAIVDGQAVSVNIEMRVPYLC